MMGTFSYNSPRWKRKRLQILKRDGYMCQHCKRYGKAVPATTVHHIQHADEYPEMAFADKNLISLCEGCHNKQHPEKATAARGRY
jgi:5-methylcytosine-specific restriction endonuclease McrA|nr:MAG TPA_asm: NinG recombination protein [Caudoviricetes sp.]